MSIKKEILEKIYYENSNIEAARKLKISVGSLIKYVKESGIKLKGKKKGNKIKII